MSANSSNVATPDPRWDSPQKSSLEEELTACCLEALDAGMEGPVVLEFMVDQTFPKRTGRITIEKLRALAKILYEDALAAEAEAAAEDE